MATKIIDGKIVRDETSNSPMSSPRLSHRTGRRSSLQDLQLKEFQLQQEQKAQEASDQQQQAQQQQQQSIESPTWKQIISQSILVFGMKMNILVLLAVSLVSVVGAGVMGLLCSLLAVYIGTLFTTQNLATAAPSSPVASSSPVSETAATQAAPTTVKPTPLQISTPPINAAQQIFTRRNSITITNGGTISPRPSSPLSSPLSMRSPRFATMSSIAEVRDKMPMLDTAC